MATYSSILAWEIPWTGDPDMLRSMGAQSQTQLNVCVEQWGRTFVQLIHPTRLFAIPVLPDLQGLFLFERKKKKPQNLKYSIFFLNVRDFSGGPVVKNPPWDVGDVGSIPGWRTGIPHAEQQLSPCAAITGAFMPPLESLCPKQRPHMMQWRSDTGRSINIFFKNLTYYEKWYLFFENVNSQFIIVSYWFRTFIEPLRK